mmetsp:Transcript_18056/g.39364  ORF Transcript_18056/g.39364 Transcript_18056/m.39364 type:complete len:119 (-) Transcript_18056:124-480(-)
MISMSMFSILSQIEITLLESEEGPVSIKKHIVMQKLQTYLVVTVCGEVCVRLTIVAVQMDDLLPADVILHLVTLNQNQLAIQYVPLRKHVMSRSKLSWRQLDLPNPQHGVDCDKFAID